MAYKNDADRKRWTARNKERLITYRREWMLKKRRALILELGGECVHCGEKDPIVLDFDHIHDDGNIDRKGNRCKDVVFLVQDDPTRFQLLCRNCNWRKEYWRRAQQK